MSDPSTAMDTDPDHTTTTTDVNDGDGDAPAAKSPSPTAASSSNNNPDKAELRVPGTVVWARLGKFPSWPSLVLDLASPSVDAETKKAGKPQQVLVRFFATHDFAWITPGQLADFGAKKAEMKTKSRAKNFLLAIEEAEEYLRSGKLPPVFEAALPQSDTNEKDLQLEEEAEDGKLQKDGNPANAEDEGLLMLMSKQPGTEAETKSKRIRKPKELLPAVSTDEEEEGDLQQQRGAVKPPAKKRGPENVEKERKHEKRLKIMRILGLAPRPMTS